MEIYDRFLQARAASETVNVDALYIDGVQMPSPALSGIEISYEKIWSNDTGRVAAPPCNMVGTILAIKRTLTIKWPTLTRAEAAKSTPPYPARLHSMSFALWTCAATIPPYRCILARRNSEFTAMCQASPTWKT